MQNVVALKAFSEKLSITVILLKQLLPPVSKMDDETLQVSKCL